VAADACCYFESAALARVEFTRPGVPRGMDAMHVTEIRTRLDASDVGVGAS
jgi:hypothetical protein